MSLRKYYLRRVTRLEPPYILTLILFYALALALRTPDIADPDFVPSFWRRLFYLNNAITGHTLNLNGVTWSLEVEIQFYLVVPLLAVVFRLPQTPRRFLMAAIVSAGPFFRFLEIGQLRLSVLNFAEYFLAGFLLADLYVTRGGRAGRGSWVADVVGLAALVTVLRFAHSEAVLRLLAWLLFAVAYAGLFGRWTPRVLAVPAVSLTGGMCYTIYLLHYPVLSFLAGRVLMPEMSYPIGLLRLALTALPVVAVASVLFFVLVERPCMIPDWPQRVHRAFRRWTAGPVA